MLVNRKRAQRADLADKLVGDLLIHMKELAAAHTLEVQMRVAVLAGGELIGCGTRIGFDEAAENSLTLKLACKAINRASRKSLPTLLNARGNFVYSKASVSVSGQKIQKYLSLFGMIA